MRKLIKNIQNYIFCAKIDPVELISIKNATLEEYLLKGGNPNRVIRDSPMLHLNFYDASIVEGLILGGARVTDIDARGRTALQKLIGTFILSAPRMVFGGDTSKEDLEVIKVLKVLLRYGADADCHILYLGEPKNALDALLIEEKLDVYQILVEWGAVPTVNTLHIAFIKKHDKLALDIAKSINIELLDQYLEKHPEAQDLLAPVTEKKQLELTITRASSATKTYKL